MSVAAPPPWRQGLACPTCAANFANWGYLAGQLPKYCPACGDAIALHATPIAAVKQEFSMATVESFGIAKLAAAAFGPLDALGHERHGRAFKALGAKEQRAVVVTMGERAREEAKRTGMYPKDVVEAAMLDAADVLRRTDPALDLGAALLQVRTIRPDLRLAASELIGLYA